MIPELNEFHDRDHWYFKRLDDGSVRIRNTALGIEHVVPATVWVSVIAHTAPGCGSPEAYSAAERLHQSGTLAHLVI